MKNFTLTLTILMLLGINLRAQDYVPFPFSDAEWNELEYHWQPVSHLNYTYAISGDVTIGSEIYQAIEYTDPETSLYAGAIRQDTLAKIVYARDYWTTGEEVVLYDFSKTEGDTVYVGENGTGPEGSYYVIDHIDSVMVGDSYRRAFYFTQPVDDAFWIEGIGSTRGLFSPISPVTTGFDYWKLTCFWHNEELLFMNPEFEDCTPNWTGIDEKPGQVQIIRLNASPNPSATGEIMLEMENTARHPDLQLKVFDVFGKVIHTQTILPAQGALRLDTSGWNAGMYVAAVYSNEKMMGKCKLMIK